MLHQHADVCEQTPNLGRSGLVAWVVGDRTRQRFAGRDVELSAVHGAGEDSADQGSHLERRVHVAASPLDGVEASPLVADDNLAPLQ